MPEAFVVMQIGNNELDRVFEEVIAPAIQQNELNPRRVDRHNRGDLLKSEIIAFLEESEIIIADLTNERPNCYLEVGYLMGLGKKTNLILTAREDHFPSSPRYRADGPKIHFDLQGYDILRWSPDSLEAFRDELATRIARRRRLVAPMANAEAALDRQLGNVLPDWLDDSREMAIRGLNALGFHSYWEALSTISPSGSWTPAKLRTSVREATIDTFGWPIGLEFETRDGMAAVPTANGVRAEIAFPREGRGPGSHFSYDFWLASRDGSFYTLRSLFEDSRNALDQIYFETRIVQVTELLLFLARLYETKLNLEPETIVTIRLVHSGLVGRRFGTVGHRFVRPGNPSQQESVETILVCSVAELSSNLTNNVRALLDNVFMVFDFHEVAENIYEEIVSKFVSGRV